MRGTQVARPSALPKNSRFRLLSFVHFLTKSYRFKAECLIL
jgi:hypothetical protein